MKKYFKYIFTLSFIVLLISSCKDDEPFFGDQVFNDISQLPYVTIQDRNEDLEDLPGNNFWSLALTSEENGNQVRIDFSTQDSEIVSHTILVGLDGANLGFSNSRCRFRVTRSNAVIQTITEFPTEIIITKQDVASALGLSIQELEAAGTVYFSGISIDSNGKSIDPANDGIEFINEDNPNDPRNGDDSIIFEEFLSCERHAYFYEWDFEQ